ncbi:MAG: DUF4271 domain-containing protein [Dysgonamonadaceae bacterium]|jgi:hypothetical protein|nr:DUF4271 domain-containing protein [Dysgonamonadaceae bacterium]
MPETSTYTDSIGINYATENDTLQNDSLPLAVHASQAPAYQLPNIERSGKPTEINAIFLVFLCCFLTISFTFSRSKQLIDSMFKEVFSTRPRQSIFYETTGNDLLTKLFFLIQFVTIASVFFFTCFSHKTTVEIPLESTFICIGFFCLLIACYLLYKWMGYYVIIHIFFDKLRGALWMEYWSALIFFSGLAMFLPAIFIYFIPGFYDLHFYVILSFFLISRIFLVYKAYTIFFNEINSLHYLFLYLCAQEIAPLFLMYKGMIYVFDIVMEKGILWI